MSTKKFVCGCKLEVHKDASGSIVGVEWDPLNVRPDCPKTWAMICEGKTGGVFQLESYLGKSYARKVKPTSISDWGDLIALIRPGALENVSEDGKNTTDHYIDIKFNNEVIHYEHPLLEDILSPTYAQNIFQEQSIKIFRELAKLSGSQADHYVRTGIGKKKPKLIAEAKELFFKGCKEQGIEEGLAEKIFSGIEAAQRYSFNKCLSGDALVELENGSLQTIEDVEIGSKIKDHNGQYTTIKNKYHNGKKQVVEFITESGKKMKCSIDHKFMCEDKVIRPLWEIVKNKYKIVCDED